MRRSQIGASLAQGEDWKPTKENCDQLYSRYNVVPGTVGSTLFGDGGATEFASYIGALINVAVKIHTNPEAWKLREASWTRCSWST